MNTYKLDRESSPYNPRLRWHVRYFTDKGECYASQYFTTKQLAELDVEWTIKAGGDAFKPT